MEQVSAAAARPSRPPTLKDVAAAAQVSIKTASRVLNDEPGASDATRQRVIDVAKKLGFRRNEIARSMRRSDRRTLSVGLIVDDIANPFFATLNRVFENELRRRGHLLLAASSDRLPERERELVEGFCSRQVDGLIVAPSRDDQSYLNSILPPETPVVFVDGLAKNFPGDAVLSDNVEGMRMAVSHLHQHGHRRIAYMGDNKINTSARERYRGFSEGMTALGLEADQRLICSSVASAETSEDCLRHMLATTPLPSAVIAANNAVSIGVLRALHGLELHTSIAMVAFDDLDLANVVTPGLTVVAQDIEEIGRTAIDRLFTRLEHRDRSQGVIARIPVGLVTRGSGEIEPNSEDCP